MNPSELRKKLLAWFDKAARTLPWRDSGPAGKRDPYHVLVSELMLQQTQVSRVAERFSRFLSRFPTVEALASADEHDVLAEWSGLGYYQRARRLQGAAIAIAETGGSFPREADELRSLPGIGPYTAGAIASLAFGAAEPAVDGNVIRVVARLDGLDDPDRRSLERRVTLRVRGLLDGAKRPGAFNEALMELGATVCTPRSPDCAACPWKAACVANKTGDQDRLPRPTPKAPKKTLHAATVVVIDENGRLLLERRPERGLWRGLWQAPTLESPTDVPSTDEITDALNVCDLSAVGTFTHETTHRTVRFEVFRGKAIDSTEGRRWVAVHELDALAMGSAQRRVLGMAVDGV